MTTSLPAAPAALDAASLLRPTSRAPAATGATKTPATVAEDFEAYFLASMLSSMFTGLDRSALGDGKEGGLFRSMLVQEYGKAMSRAGGVGIAEMVQREILRHQEVETP